MALSVKKYIDNLRNFDRTSDFISMVSLALHLGKHQFPISIKKLITEGGTGTTPTKTNISPVPDYIKLTTGSWQIEVDFKYLVSTPSGSFPTISIPESFLPALPRMPDSYEIIFPNNFCGIRIPLAERFCWYDESDKILGDLRSDYHQVYNSMRQNEDDPALYQHGNDTGSIYEYIEFTGPMGGCATSGKDWVFPQPFTKNGILAYDNRTVRLVIELGQSGPIEFLNYQLQPGKPLNPLKYYDVSIKKAIKEIIRQFILSNRSDEISSIFNYIREGCEADPAMCKEDGWDEWLPWA